YSPADWQKAIAPALQQVLVRVSGDPNIARNAIIRKAVAKPNSLVQSYNYVTNVGQKTLMLQVRFSPKAINNLLQNIDQRGLATNSDISTATSPTSTSSATTGTLSKVSYSPQQAVASQSVNMVISGIKDLQDYTAVLDYLRHLEG